MLTSLRLHATAVTVVARSLMLVRAADADARLASPLYRAQQTNPDPGDSHPT